MLITKIIHFQCQLKIFLIKLCGLDENLLLVFYPELYKMYKKNKKKTNRLRKELKLNEKSLFIQKTKIENNIYYFSTRKRI